MSKNRRLEKLTEKYGRGSLTQSEFQEFLHMLNISESLDNLDNILDGYWHRMAKDPGLSRGRRAFLIFKRKRRLLGWGIAASFLVLMSVVYYFGIHFPGPYTTYKTGFGEVLEVKLPDGSMATLNANSALVWNNGWEKDGFRAVALKGEAFFDIKNLGGMTFTVNTDDISVEVVGTSFNVDSRKEKTEVYLDEGKVKLHVTGELENAIVLKPGDRVRYHVSQKKIERTANESMISSASWKKNVLNFKNMKFKEVLDKLSNIYGKIFTCDDEELLSKRIYLGVPYTDWEAVRRALELSLEIRLKEWGQGYIVVSE